MAKLCALRLLRQLPPAAASAGRVRCVAFGAPALGNAALAALVAARRWDRLFYSLTLPGAMRVRACEEREWVKDRLLFCPIIPGALRPQHAARVWVSM